QDRVVVVVITLETGNELRHADPSPHCKCADVIGDAAFLRRDEIGKREISTGVCLLLLTQRVHAADRVAPEIVAIELDVVTYGIRAPETVRGACRQQSFRNRFW